MPRTAAIGIQDFETIITNNYFAIIMEFKVYDAEDEKTLEDTSHAALLQIEEKHYDTSLMAEGIPIGHIKKYGFAFKGKNVFIS